ncbi:MAG: 50S ribosomal protein L20 [Candidatus Omnitrophica bacterium]|nr:50S ribosomal protein L20 [Candidatus Omnitrophota bacterium]
MPRVKSSVTAKRRHKRFLKLAKGNWGGRGTRYRMARETVQKGMMYAWRDRRARKGDFRSLWITRITAACRERGISYSGFIGALAKAKVAINRKMLAELAVNDAPAFDKLVEIVG